MLFIGAGLGFPRFYNRLSAEMIEEMWQKKVLGKHDGEALTNVNFLNISQHCEFRGHQEHHKLKFGDFKIVLYKCRRVPRVVSGTTKENFSKWKEV